ncbi:MAG: hypothetical protein HQK53_12355 [Oligoflexia bacterium]|nr:hypothetical protein [Oligoflexia bacterium]
MLQSSVINNVLKTLKPLKKIIVKLALDLVLARKALTRKGQVFVLGLFLFQTVIFLSMIYFKVLQVENVHFKKEMAHHYSCGSVTDEQKR